MSSNFEWQTDEEGWPDEPVQEPAGSPRPIRLPILLILLLALGTGVAFGGYRILNDRAAAGIEEAEASLLATQATLQRAALSADSELATGLLSDRDHTWSAAQHEVIGAGLFYDRSVWDLAAVDEPTIETYEIHPTLQSAVVTTTQTLRSGSGDGASFTVQRRQLFRRGDAAWLMVPPVDDGVVWTKNSSTIFTISYRNRDARVGAPLAAELEARLRDLCATGAAACTEESPLIDIRLTDDPHALLHNAAPVPIVQRTDVVPDPTLELPSPALMGEPVDDAGASALVEIYVRLVVDAVLADQASYRCCDHFHLHATLADYQRAAIGMNPHPQTNLEVPGTLAELDPIWNATDLVDDDGAAATLVEFLRAETRLPLVEIHRSLATTRQRSLAAWMGELLPRVPADLRDDLWHSYLSERRYVAARPNLLPEQRFVGFCPTRDVAGLFYLDVGVIEGTNGAWPWEQTYLIDRSDVTLAAAGGGELLILQEETTANLRSSILLLQESGPQRLTAASFGRSVPVLLGKSDPTGRYLPGFVAGPNLNDFRYVLLDRSACTAGECRLLEIAGRPVWSPDGRRTLLQAEDRNANPGDLLFEYALHAGGPAGEEPTLLGYGTAPAWLDNRTAIFADRSLEEAENAVRQYRVGASETEVVLRLPQLLETIPADLRAGTEPFVIDNLFVNPHDLEQIYVVVRRQRTAGESHLLLYRRNTLTHVARLPGVPDRDAARFSPSGRWMALAVSDPESDVDGLLFLYDLYHQRHELLFGGIIQDAPHHPGLDWSADGQWLLATTRRGPTLVAPAFDRIVAAPPASPICDALFWTAP